MNAPKLYPPIIEPARWCRNGQVPDAYLLRRLVGMQNHLMAYRRKTFARWGNVDTIEAGATGDLNMWRFRGHTGYGATHVEFALGVIPPASFSDTLTPTVTISLTEVGVGTTSEVLTFAPNASSITAAPDRVSWVYPRIAVSANATIEVVVTTNDFVQIQSFGAYEIASPAVAGGTDFYHEIAQGIEQPVIDSIRQRLMQGFRGMWKRNGQHLLSFLGDGSGTNPSVTGTTCTNVIDGGTGGWAASSPGVYISDTGNGGPALPYRLSDGGSPGFQCVLAVYGQVTTASNGGEVRLYDDAEGEVIKITGITTTLQWHTTTATIANIDTLAKLDLEMRHATAGHTLRVDAVSLYTYET